MSNISPPSNLPLGLLVSILAAVGFLFGTGAVISVSSFLREATLLTAFGSGAVAGGVVVIATVVVNWSLPMTKEPGQTHLHCLLTTLKSSRKHSSSWTFTNYDAKRNLTGLKEHFHASPPTTYNYSYEPTSQLTSATRGALSLDDDDDEFDDNAKDASKNQSAPEETQALNDSYVYDASGNPTTFTDSGHASLHAYNASNQLTDSGYTYDANGNLTSNGIQTFGWDAADRLVTITQGSGATKISYDGLGRFVRITDTGTATNSDVRYLWDGDSFVAQLDANETTVLKRYFANGVQVGTTNSYYTQDVLGSIRELTAQTGKLQARFDYEPFGSRKTLRGSGTAD